MTKPHILLLVDQPNWAYDISAKEIQRHLSNEFVFDIQYVVEEPVLKSESYDLMHVFYWAGQYHKKFHSPPEKILLEVASQKWIDMKPRMNLKKVHKYYLSDYGSLVTPSVEIQTSLKKYGARVMHGPNGFSEYILTSPVASSKNGAMILGWAGSQSPVNINLKGLGDILKPAVGNTYQFRIASDLPPELMAEFYSDLDIICVASRHECEPLTIIEGMAMGCFPVATKVGVVPELVEHKRNGYIVETRSPEAFREAFLWCRRHLDYIRDTRLERAEEIRNIRSWEVCSKKWSEIYHSAIKFAKENPSRPNFKYRAIPNPKNRWDRKLERFLRPYFRKIKEKINKNNE